MYHKELDGTSTTVQHISDSKDLLEDFTTVNDDSHYYDYNELATEIVKEELKLQNSEFPGLESYTIIEKIGEGAFSTVHKATNLLTNELVAIKIIKKHQLDKHQRQSVLKEATLMRQMNHDNIVKFVEFKEVDQYYYIIQELVQGGEIFNEIVKFTYFSENLTRHVIRQVGEAVKYLHEEVGVVHRDIKPENLLFEPISIIPSKSIKRRRSDDPNKVDEGQFINGLGGGGIGIVKLADFGLSKQIWYDETKTPCGTVGYTAPEIVRDQHYSREVDMWALGCVLYTLLCGFPPFYDDQIDVLTEKVARGQYTFLQPWWDEISIGAKRCVASLLTVDPNKRYDINQFLNDPWLNELEYRKPQKQTLRENFKRSTYDFSPAARIMKDAFDISNELHRIGEEKITKKRNLNTDQIVEEEEEEMEKAAHPSVGELETNSGTVISKVELNARQADIDRYQEHQRHLQEHVNQDSTFELSMKASTIMNRRKHKVSS